MAKEIKTITDLRKSLETIDVEKLDFGSVKPTLKEDGSYDFELDQTADLNEVHKIIKRLNSRFSVVQKAAWKEAVGPLLAEDKEERQYLAERMYKKNNTTVSSDNQN